MARSARCTAELLILVLVIFLPPLLYVAACCADLRDLRTNLRAISLLSIGLVLLTAVTAAAASRYELGLENTRLEI